MPTPRLFASTLLLALFLALPARAEVPLVDEIPSSVEAAPLDAEAPPSQADLARALERLETLDRELGRELGGDVGRMLEWLVSARSAPYMSRLALNYFRAASAAPTGPASPAPDSTGR